MPILNRKSFNSERNCLTVSSVFLITLSGTIPLLASVGEKFFYYLHPPHHLLPRMGKVEKSIFSTVRVVLVSMRLL